MMKESNKIILLHSVILRAMQISLSAGKDWFLFFKFRLSAVLMLFSFKKILQNTVHTVQLNFEFTWISVLFQVENLIYNTKRRVCGGWRINGSLVSCKKCRLWASDGDLCQAVEAQKGGDDSIAIPVFKAKRNHVGSNMKNSVTSTTNTLDYLNFVENKPKDCLVK